MTPLWITSQPQQRQTSHFTLPRWLPRRNRQTHQSVHRLKCPRARCLKWNTKKRLSCQSPRQTVWPHHSTRRTAVSYGYDQSAIISPQSSICNRQSELRYYNMGLLAALQTTLVTKVKAKKKKKKKKVKVRPYLVEGGGAKLTMPP